MVGGQVEHGERLAIFPYGVAFVQRRQFAADRAPDLLLGVEIRDLRGALTGTPGERGGGDLVAPSAILRILGAGVAVVQVYRDLAARSGRHR